MGLTKKVTISVKKLSFKSSTSVRKNYKCTSLGLDFTTKNWQKTARDQVVQKRTI